MLKTSQYIFGPFCNENDGRPKFLLKLVKQRLAKCALDMGFEVGYCRGYSWHQSNF